MSPDLFISFILICVLNSKFLLNRPPVLAVALEGEGDARVVDGVLGDDVGHARELVRAGPEDLAARRHVVEEVLHRDLRALGFDSRVK